MIIYLASLFVMGGASLALWALKPEPRTVSIGVDPDDVAPSSREVELASSFSERVLRPLADNMSRRFGRFMPHGVLDNMHRTLRAADLERKYSPEMVVGAQVVGFVLGMFLATAYISRSGADRTNLLVGGLIVLLFTMGPSAKVKRTADDRRKAITNELPDILDQLTVTVEAGMSFDGAVQRAGQEGRGIMALELRKVIHDMQLGLSRGEALQVLAERTDVADLRGFVTAVRQAEKHGFPLANILRLQSLELRDRRRARAEERAMQIPVKITFPLVFCILPSLFVVILGPAAVNISSGLGG